MANTTNMIRLMQHAADLLDACQPMANAREVARLSPSTSDRADSCDHAAQEVAAIATASTVLRMVAAAMDDEPAACNKRGPFWENAVDSYPSAELERLNAAAPSTPEANR